MKAIATTLAVFALLSATLALEVRPRASVKATTGAYYAISFPIVSLKTHAGERISSIELMMHCGRFTALNVIPDDWSAEVVSPVSEETTLKMEAGHGISYLWHSRDLERFITILVVDSDCFDITASLNATYYDGREHERKISFGQKELVIRRVPYKSAR